MLDIRRFQKPKPWQKSFFKGFAYLWSKRSLWVRAALCWFIGAAFFLSNESANYDWRFQTRPAAKPPENIVLLEVGEREWSELAEGSQRRNVLRPLKELLQASDSYYWKASVWRAALAKLLDAEPAAVGMLFFFGDEARIDRVGRLAAKDPLADSRVLWSADLDAAGRVAIPGIALPYNSNVALKTLHADDDGILRRFFSTLAPVPHMALKLAEAADPGAHELADFAPLEPEIVDFFGPSGTFPSYSLRDLMAGELDPSLFRGKIVLVGPRELALSTTLTPVGRLTRAEAIANITGDALGKRWIRRASNPWYLGMLAGLLLLSLWILSSYPQAVALAYFMGLALSWAAASAWAFDSRRFWLPALAPIVQIVATYIVFLSYQLARNERRAWRLEQERRYFAEVENLKNNFVSMMSHDLKTPIAKIQAIASGALSRLKPGDDPSLAEAFDEVRRSSDDLDRYIRSILQVVKLEAREFQIKREPIDVNEAIVRAAERLRPLAKAKHIHLDWKLEPMFSIEADSILIQEIVSNLVENAIKYTPAEGSVSILSQETDDNVRVSVEDTGPGIEISEQAGIWGKFTRGRKHSLDAQGPAGSGLGLYLVKYFVELHGGRVFFRKRARQRLKVRVFDTGFGALRRPYARRTRPKRGIRFGPSGQARN